MHHHSQLSLALAVLLTGAAQAAFAHVDYFDLGAGLFIDAHGASYDEEAFSSDGWFDGTRPMLGDSHDLAGGRFFRFHLAQAARVTIRFEDVANSGALNPAFSLYAGLLPDDAHDDAAADPLNPKHLVFSPPPPHAVKDPSPVDNGVKRDAQGRVSPLRDTAHVEFAGQFDALHDWSMANASGAWSVVDYLTHVAPGGGNGVSLVGYLLDAGDYTIAAGGGWDGLNLSGVLGRISYSAAPVPLPGAGLLFGAALLALAARRRRG